MKPTSLVTKQLSAPDLFLLSNMIQPLVPDTSFYKIKSWTLNEAAGKKGVKQLELGVFPYSIYNGTKYK